MDPPSDRVPEQGPDWFLVAIEACGGGNPDLGYVLMFSGYMSIYIGERSRSVEPRGAHEGGGVPTPLGAPSYLMAASLLP